jgi:acetyl esterase
MSGGPAAQRPEVRHQLPPAPGTNEPGLLGDSVLRADRNGPARTDIDPTFKALLDALPMIFNLADGVDAVRARVKQLQVPPEMLPDLRIEDRTVSYGEHADIAVRVCWPPTEAASADLPIIVFYHGGGWSTGDLDTHDAVARAHCVAADAVVVSVDYRLAPEHPFPAGINDSWAALRWVGEHAAELGGDPKRIAVAGDSAGANISAVMAQLARDNAVTGCPPIAFQLLWYPWITSNTSLRSFTENADAPLLDRNAVETFLTWYAPSFDLSDHRTLPPTLAPSNAVDLSGLPPAFIGTAGHDSLRDHGAQYAALLEAAGVSVQLSNEPTLVHGYVNFAHVVPAAAEATKRGLAALRKALHP